MLDLLPIDTDFTLRHTSVLHNLTQFLLDVTQEKILNEHFKEQTYKKLQNLQILKKKWCRKFSCDLCWVNEHKEVLIYYLVLPQG